MALDKAIKSGKEHRIAYGSKSQPYCKAVDHTCRNHGGCPYCEQNRKHKFRDKHPVTKDEWVVWITDGRKDPSFLLLFFRPGSNGHRSIFSFIISRSTRKI